MYVPQQERQRGRKAAVSVEGLSEQIDKEIPGGWISKDRAEYSSLIEAHSLKSVSLHSNLPALSCKHSHVSMSQTFFKRIN